MWANCMHGPVKAQSAKRGRASMRSVAVVRSHSLLMLTFADRALLVFSVSAPPRWYFV